jgi:hypothetical protein
MSVIPNISLLKITKRKVYTDEKIAEDIKQTLQRIQSNADDLLQRESELKSIDEKELKQHPKYPEYFEWVRYEFKTELEIRALAGNILKFCRDLMALENSIEEKSRTKEFFEHYQKFQEEYDARIWKLIGPVEWLESASVRDLEKTEDIITKEKPWAKRFPELMPILKRKYGALYVEVTKLGNLVVDLKHIRGYLLAQRAIER